LAEVQEHPTRRVGIEAQLSIDEKMQQHGRRRNSEGSRQMRNDVVKDVNISRLDRVEPPEKTK
jgi:hypothetical protein